MLNKPAVFIPVSFDSEDEHEQQAAVEPWADLENKINKLVREKIPKTVAKTEALLNDFAALRNEVNDQVSGNPEWSTWESRSRNCENKKSKLSIEIWFKMSHLWSVMLLILVK